MNGKQQRSKRRKGKGAAGALQRTRTKTSGRKAPEKPSAFEEAEARRLKDVAARQEARVAAVQEVARQRRAKRRSKRMTRLVYRMQTSTSRATGLLVVDVSVESDSGEEPLVELTHLTDECDERVQRMLPIGQHRSLFKTFAEDPAGRFRLDSEQVRRALPWMARSDRAFRDDLEMAIEWTDDGAWTPNLRVDDSGDLDVTLSRGDEYLDLDVNDAPILAGDYFVTSESAGLVKAAGGLRWALDLAADPPSDVTAALVDAPRGLGIEHAAAPLGEPAGIVLVGAPDGSAELPVRLAFDYEGSRVHFREGSEVVLLASGAALRRDLSREKRCFDALVGTRLLTRPMGEPRMLSANLPQLVTKCAPLGWCVEAEERRLRAQSTSSLSVHSGTRWFELRGELRFDDMASADVSALVTAAREGQRWVVLDDGSAGLLPESWLKGWSPLALARNKHGALRFHRSQGGLLDSWLREQQVQGSIASDADFESYRERLATMGEVRAQDPPQSFVGDLRDYQREALGWFARLTQLEAGGCLADDMGLGKTVQVLALLAARNEAGAGPSLVVAPRSVVFQWITEAGRFAPQLKCLEHAGPGRASGPQELDQADLILTSYGTLRRDIDWLKEVEFDVLVLDEAHAIKNATSQTARAALELRGRQRLALTGTPIENHLGDLWSLCEFLNPGMLGPRSAYAELVAVSGPGSQRQREQRIEPLRRAIGPFFLRRTKGEVLTSLPPKTEQTILLTLDSTERQRYEGLRAAYLDRMGAGPGQPKRSKSFVALEALLRLRQAACHPGLIDPERLDEGSTKVDELVERLVAIAEEGHKALVFSQFTKLLGIVRERLDQRSVDYEYLDGRTRKRAPRIERFQEDPQCAAFLISLKAGGQGLNLTAADFVFLLDPWWNPAVEAQAIDRAHRMGRTRPVVAYRLVARDTVEEKVLELQQHKRELADAILTGATGALGGLTAEVLDELLGSPPPTSRPRPA